MYSFHLIISSFRSQIVFLSVRFPFWNVLLSPVPYFAFLCKLIESYFLSNSNLWIFLIQRNFLSNCFIYLSPDYFVYIFVTFFILILESSSLSIYFRISSVIYLFLLLFLFDINLSSVILEIDYLMAVPLIISFYIFCLFYSFFNLYIAVFLVFASFKYSL